MKKTMAMVAAVAGLAFAAPTALAASTPKDYSSTALNIIPSGQADPGQTLAPGTLPNDAQARMYDTLTPLFNRVTNADLNRDFKSERYGTNGECPCSSESVPYPGVTIVRDKYDVPHVSATTHAGGVWASGWIAAEDRGLLLSQARYDSLVAAIDAPGLSAIGLIENLDNFTPSKRTERVVNRQTQVLLRHGPEGHAVVRDIDSFVKGINAYNAIHNPSQANFTRGDIYAFNALKDQFFGEGGGNQAQNAELVSGLERRLGSKKGYSVFDDLRQNLNAGSPTTVDGTFNYNHDPNKPGSPGSVLLKPGSYKQYTYASTKVTGDLGSLEPRPHASNELMVEGRYSATGHPLLVGGPQVGYFYPGLTYEIDMHAPGLNWRGATSAPFPGYLLIGRGADFATTLTSASADDTDEFAETLCGHSKTKYMYNGKCRAMQRFKAGTVTTSDKRTFPVTFWMTVNGPVIGYATAGGKRVAITSKRASYGKDALDLLFNRRLSDGQVHGPKSFIKAASLTPQTFNSFYVDSKHVAEITTGLLPVRAKGTDPSLPTVGNGSYQWHGFLSVKGHPQGVDPSHTPVKGTMVNWNNVSAHGFGSSPDAFGANGSVARVSLLNRALTQQRGKNGKWTLAGVASAMNTAATQNVLAVETVPLLAKLLKGSKAPDKRASRMLKVLVSWSRHGGNLLSNSKDQIANPGAAVINGAWPKLANAFMRPVLGPQLGELNSLFSRFDAPPGGQYSGWYQYFARDIDRLLKIKQPQPFRNAYCGKGNVKRCRHAMWTALSSAGRQLTKQYGTSNPTAWHASAKPIAIHFAPLPLITMRYTNRPSGIQQAITFRGHR